MAEKFNREKEKSENLKELKARLNFEGCSRTSRYSESKTVNTKEHEKRNRSRRSHSLRTSVFSRIRCERSRSPRLRVKEGGVFKRLGSRGKNVSARSDSYSQRSYTRRTETLSESKDSEGGHWKSRSKKKKSSGEEDDLSQPWVYEETYPFTPRIRYFDFPKTRIPSHIKTYDGRNSRVWFNDLSHESIDSYDDLKKVFLKNYLQQKKYIKDPIELHNIKQQDGESMEDFVRRYKLESRDVKGAPECIRISGFVHGITNPELIKCLHDKIPKTLDEMIRVTTSFLRGEVAASNHERKKPFPPWKQHDGNQKQNFKKGGKFKAPPPMTTPVEKWNHAEFCEFHGEVGHNTDECMHLKKQIKEMLKAGKLVARQRITQSFSPNPEIFFPLLGEDEGTKGPLIIEAEIGGHCVHRMYVDGGSASEILYEHCFSRLRSEIKKQLIPATTLLIRFSGEIMWPIGKIQLLVKVGDEEHSASAWMNFMVVRSSSPYNGIIGRPGVRRLQAVPSTAHGMIKILVEGGVITLKSSKLVPLECMVVFGPEGTPSAAKPTIEERVKIAINPEYPEQIVMISSTLTEEGNNKLCGILQRNLDIFDWKPTDMIGVPRHIAEHRLNVQEGCSPVRQKKRGQTADRNQAIQEEVRKLVEAEIMKEVYYHDWLSNLVMVKKHDNSWRMCVDFKDLNKAFLKGGYLLPKIDWKVESLCGFPFKFFLDAYKGYHQIHMEKEDEEKTAFIISQGIFCYTKMPFGLRNAGSTYQRLVDKVFHKQIG
ncbi:reverse transcriptase domain-containing protein [Tanacetum coccineum]